MNKDDVHSVPLSKEDIAYRIGAIPRDCSCGLSLFAEDYTKHLKDGVHERRIQERKKK